MKRTRGIGFVLSLILVFSLAMGSMPVYGKGMFTDVDENYWGYDYIEKMVNLGLMDGYADGTFRPNERVNRADALVYVTRLMGIPKAEVEKMRKEHDTFLNKFNLTEGRKDGLAIALSKGLVNEKFITNNLFDKGKLKDATKLEVCVYIVKAMGMEEEAKGRPAIFTFEDSNAIPVEVRPYVKFLIEKKVIDEKGDGQNRFNPNQSITRAVLAKILSLTYDQMSGDPITSPKDPIEQPIMDKGNYGELVGIIVGKIGGFIFIDNGQNLDSYKPSEDIQILIAGNAATVDELKEGMNIKAAVDKDNILRSITVDSTNDIISGTIKKVSLGTPSSMEIKVKDTESTKTFYLSKETKVSIDGKDSYLFSLNEGDSVKVEALDSLALTITGESKDGKMKPIDIESIKGEDEGYIKGILISENPKLTIESNKGSLMDYYMSRDISIRIDKEVKDIYDLRLGDLAKLKLENGQIVNLEVEKKMETNEPVGIVEYVNVDSRFLILRNQTTLKTSNINVSAKAIIKDMEGSTLELKDLVKGTKLLVTGNYDRGQFVAEEIIVIK